MNEYEISSLSRQDIMIWVTVAYTAISFMTFCLIGYGIFIMNRSNNKRSDDINALNERIFHADERRHKEAMDRHKEAMDRHEEAMAAHKESMEAHKASHEESMAAHEESMKRSTAAHEESMKQSTAAHEESMTALKALIANGEETSKVLVELLKRTEPLPAVPTGAD